MKEKVNKYKFIFDSIVYVLSHATKMQLFCSQMRANDVLPCVPIFDYLKKFIIIILKKFKMFNSNVWMILYYDTWLNVNMPSGIKNILIMGW
jgi:hypothetical protein